jgi:hypothetical protein
MRSLSLTLMTVLLAAACSAASPTPVPLPSPTCGGIEIAIPGAMSCQDAAQRAVAALRERAPDQVRRGITGIEVRLDLCPVGEVPPQIDCTGVEHAYLVTVHFNVVADNLAAEDSLTVGIDPVSGRILGIANPLIR